LCVGTVIDAILVVLLIQKNYEKFPKFSTRTKCMVISSILCPLFNALFNFLAIGLGFNLFPLSACVVISSLDLSFSFLGKIAVYLFFLLRIDVIFRDSEYGLLPSNFALGYVLIVLNAVTIAATLPLFWESNTQTLYGVVYCNPTASPIFWYLVILWDVLLSTLLIGVFIYKMGQVNKSIEPDDNKSHNRSVSIILKYAILGSIAIASTIINLGLVAEFNWVWPESLDTIISSICVYLTYGYKNRKLESKIIGVISEWCCCVYCCCRNFQNYIQNEEYSNLNTTTSVPSQKEQTLELSS